MTSPNPVSDSIPATRRDGLTALLLLALVLAALVLGYRTSQSVSVAPVAATEDEVAVDPSAYDLDTAMKLSGDEVPPEKDGYYFVAFLDEAPPEQEIAELASKLELASQEHDYLGITGPDAERNRRNLLGALKADEGKNLGGAIVIYLGPAEQRDELIQAVKAAGADFRFVVYPDEAKPGEPPT